MPLRPKNAFRVPKGFVDLVLWPEFSDLDKALVAYLHEVTLHVIREEVYSDTSDAQRITNNGRVALYPAGLSFPLCGSEIPDPGA